MTGRRSIRPGLSQEDIQALQRKLALGNGGQFAVPRDVVAFGVSRDALWPKSVALWIVLAVVCLLLSAQFVSPTRRWRLRRGGAGRRERGLMNARSWPARPTRRSPGPAGLRRSCRPIPRWS